MVAGPLGRLRSATGSVADMVQDLIADTGDVMGRVRVLRALAQRMSGASPETARYFAPGLSVPASTIYSIGDLGTINAGTQADTQFQIPRPGVAVGILISGRGLAGMTLDEEAANLQWQLTREATISTAASIASSQPNGPGFASVRGMTSQWPWLPLIVPVRGAGVWTLTVRNIHPAEPIAVVANLAFLEGADAYHRACVELSATPDLVP